MVAEIPQYTELLWPALVAVAERGGSASIDEIIETAIKNEGFTDAQQSVLHLDGPGSEIEYRLAWARSYLKGMQLLINSRRGVWSLTETGRQVHAELRDASEGVRRAAIRERHQAFLAGYRKRGRPRVELQVIVEPDSELVDPAELEPSRDWRAELLEALLALHPAAFERLAQRLLREAGFISAVVTGRSGDGGIDGVGVYRLSLVSFPIFFQCKRYKGTVGPSAVRDFRGAMAGRGDKGLLITTSGFTADAKAEASRDGAPPVDLIDGERLCDLLKQYEIGVRTSIRQVEDVTVDHDTLMKL